MFPAPTRPYMTSKVACWFLQETIRHLRTRSYVFLKTLILKRKLWRALKKSFQKSFRGKHTYTNFFQFLRRFARNQPTNFVIPSSADVVGSQLRSFFAFETSAYVISTLAW